MNSLERRGRLEVVGVGVVLVASLIDPLYRSDQLLQHVPTVPALAGLYLIAGRRALSLASLRALLLFILLHILGARFVYSCVPYDDAVRAVSGQTLSAALGWTRNHYDRFVHLAFGTLVVLPVAELGWRNGRMARGWAVLFAMSTVLSVSALYECFEWGLSMMVSPDLSENYNGQQGDLWDAQKDMALAGLGALFGAGAISLKDFGREESMRTSEAP